MIPEHVLIGWLCFLVNNYDEDLTVALPFAVRDALKDRGWFAQDAELDWKGQRPGWITPAGRAVFDLNGADWGIDTIPEEAGT